MPTSEIKEKEVQKKNGNDRHRFLTALVLILLVVAFGFFAYYEFKDRTTHVFETDARINAKLITVSSRVAGRVTNVVVNQGQKVKIGDTLVNIDSRNTNLFNAELEAQLGAIHAQKKRIEAESNLVKNQNESRLASEKSKLNAAQVIVSSLKPQLELIRRDLERTKTLYQQKVISRRQLDQTETKLQRIKREHQIALANLKASRAKVKEVAAEQSKLDILAADILVLSNKEIEIKAKIARNLLDFEDRKIKSLINGVIDKTFIEVGEFINPGQRLLLLHNPEEIWIEANIKETSVRRLKIGQQVEVTVDAYPDEMFVGILETIGNTATSAFALIPSPNPSGNFTKITQRIPIRIAIAQREGRLRPGMMTEIKIVTK